MLFKLKSLSGDNSNWQYKHPRIILAYIFASTKAMEGNE